MGTGIYLSIYHWRANWNYFIQFFTRYYSTWYLLRSSAFPLCIKNGGRICHLCSIYALISITLRANPTYTMSQCPIFPNILRGKSHLLSTTLSGFKGNTTTIFRLPRCLYKMKCSFLIGIPSFICSTNTLYLHLMRSLCLSTKGLCQPTSSNINRMNWYHTTPRFSQSRRNGNYYIP